MERRWDTAVVVALGYLAVVDLVVGLWALAKPTSFFSSFPGLGQHWVAANPRYNHHLTIDAGAGFFAVGIVLVLAAAWRERRLVQAALIASLAHDVPHFLFHVVHPAHVLSTMSQAANNGGLFFSCLVAAVALVAVTRSR